MSEVSVNGTTIWYERDGAGRPCLVLHGGLGVDHTMYRRSLQPLTTRLELVLLDHRGNGRSGRPPVETITIEQLAEDAAAVASALGLAHVLVFGHSYGGFVAQELTLRHRELVSGLMLVDTTPGQLGTGESEDDYRGPPPPPEFLEVLSSFPESDEELAQGTAMLAPHYLHQRDPADLMELFAGTIYSRDALVQGFVSLASWSAVDRLASITCPTFVAAGRHDVLTSPPQVDRIADRITGSTRVIFEQSGHMPWFDEPEAFFAAVGGWLDAHSLR
ncbi:MAG TPA: alpha/beta hydrolase [Acidimicrobiales bacterium]|nr:alpha/beta hydrolase [Acidimicrobiales bacterium]